MMFISLRLHIPVVVVCEVPFHDWIIINKADIDRILQVTAPDWVLWLPIDANNHKYRQCNF